MMTGCANVVFLKEVKSRRCDKDHIDKPLIVARTEELVSHAIERMRKYKISQIPNGYVGICRFLESDLFQSYVHDKTQPKDQLRKSWEVLILLYKWERQSKFLNCSTGTMQQY
jgi:hypothetical protein